MYEIRLCKHDELNLLKSYLENSWSDKHIFLKDQSILDFQHRSLEAYNFVVAYHKEHKCFHGVLGIVSPNFYVNKSISHGNDIWLAIWKVDKQLAEYNWLGMDLLNYVSSKFEPRSISAIGINEKVAHLYKLIGYKVTKMRQWFIPNLEFNKFQLITGNIVPGKEKLISNYYILDLTKDNKKKISEFLSNNTVRESFKYLSARYLDHPCYEYKIIGVCDVNDKLVAVFVGREVFANDSKAFRLTELFLDCLTQKDYSGAFDNFMKMNSYEYIDFLEFGLEEKILKQFKFLPCTENLYVPHLFEPFVKDRKEVIIAYKSDHQYYCTKGDSDLDRPNRKISNV